MPTTRPGWLSHRVTLAELSVWSQADAFAQLRTLIGPTGSTGGPDGGEHSGKPMPLQTVIAAMGVLTVVAMYALVLRHLAGLAP